MPKLFIALAGAMLVTVPAFAATTDQPADTAPSVTAAPPAAAKKICRYESATGSFMSKRVCHTKAEWAAMNAASETQARSSLDNFRRNRNGVGGN